MRKSLTRPLARSLLPMSLVALSAEAQQNQLRTVKWALEVAAGGGFAGLSEVAVQQEPNLTCTTATPPVCTPDPANKVLVRNKAYSWRPSVATGIVFRMLFRETTEDRAADAWGAGHGTHFVFVPKSEGEARPAPALAIHVGKAQMQAFAGFILVPTNEATLPGGGNRAIVPIGFDQTHAGAQ